MTLLAITILVWFFLALAILALCVTVRRGDRHLFAEADFSGTSEHGEGITVVRFLESPGGELDEEILYDEIQAA